MKSKLPSVRQIGQLPLPPSFLLKPSNSSNESTQEDSQITKPLQKKSCISLSDFLNRKLDKDAMPPKTVVQEKQRPFSSVVEQKDGVGGVDGHIGTKRRLDEKVFQQFKHPRKEKEDSNGLSTEFELEGSTTRMEQDSRERNPFRVCSIGRQKKCTTPRHLLILGDDPKPRLKRRDVSFIPKKKPKALYNHYANGSGWWDCNMEGFDSEEVGCSDAWEGMGATTTLGGMDWH